MKKITAAERRDAELQEMYQTRLNAYRQHQAGLLTEHLLNAGFDTDEIKWVVFDVTDQELDGRSIAGRRRRLFGLPRRHFGFRPPA